MSASAGRAKRGRPLKFGRPAHVVAVTLPDEVVRGLKRLHTDLGWAIVTLVEQTSRRRAVPHAPSPDVELVTVAGRQSLIVVNKDVFRSLPGVNIIPLQDDRAFLALEPGRGIADLELAVIDRLAISGINTRERRALERLRADLRAWRRDRALSSQTRAIIVLERRKRRSGPAARRRSRAR